jgi:NAD-dependent deacetylase
MFRNLPDYPHIVVLTGAGVSAESGLKTFRDSGGLWEEHNILDVATPEAWKKNPELVLRFYNERRKQLDTVKPNLAHLALADLEEKFKVHIITQNVDDLHERAGSKNVVHLHGELRKARSERFPNLIYTLDKPEINLGDVCQRGFQLRPHIVWFGEDVPLIQVAAELVRTADVLLIIGTSLNVYPAAGLIAHAPYECRKYLIDPNETQQGSLYKLKHIKEMAGKAVPELVEELINSIK